MKISQLSAQDASAAAAVLAKAFNDDPVVRWLLPQTDLRRFFLADIAHWHAAPGCSDIAVRDGEVVGTALWDPPGHCVTGVDRIRGALSALRAMGSRVLLGDIAQRFLESHRPNEGHWHLAVVGATIPGQGIGSSLLEHRLERLDKPAFLECSNERSIPLYERFGFRITEEVHMPRGGPLVWLMLRP